MGAIMQFSGGGVTNNVQALDTSLKTKREINNIQSMGTGDAGKIGPTLNNVANLSASFIQAQNTTEANDAKADTLNLLQSPGYRDADHRGRLEMLDEVKSTLPSRSKAYADAFIGYSSGEYIRQYDASREQAKLDHYNAAPAAFKAYRTEKETEGKAPDTATFIKDYIAKYPGAGLDKVVMGRAVMAENMSEAMMIIDSAPDTEEGLTKAQTDVKDLLHPLESPMFLNTKQKQGQSYVANLKRQLQLVVKAKEQKIKAGYYNQLAEAEKTGNRTPPELIQKAIFSTASNTFTAQKQYDDYIKKHNEITESDTYNATYLPGDRPGALPANNPTLKKERAKLVVNSLTTDFNNDSYSKFISTAINEQGLTKDFGETLLIQFNKANTSEEAGAILTKIDEISKLPNGAAAIRQMMSDDDYITLNHIAEISRIEGISIKEAKNIVDKGKQNTAFVKLEPDDKASINKLAVKLGTQGASYLATMNTLIQSNPKFAKGYYKKLYNQYTKQVVDSPSGTPTDISMGIPPYADKNIISPKNVSTAIDNMAPDGTSNIMYLPGGKALFINKYGGTIDYRDVNGVVNDSEDKTQADLLLKHKQDENDIRTNAFYAALSAGKSFLRTGIDNAAAVAEGYPKVLGGLAATLVERFGKHMWDSMTPGQQEFFKGWSTGDKEDASSELIFKTIKEVKEEYPIEMPDIFNNTAPQTVKDMMPYTIQLNKAIRSRLDNVSDEFSKIKEAADNAKILSSNPTVDVKDIGIKAQIDVGTFVDGVLGPKTKKAFIQKYGSTEGLALYEEARKNQRGYFKQKIEPIATNIAPKIGTNINPKWIMTQWMLETSKGNSVPAGTNNLGGIKGEYNGKSKTFTTKEDTNKGMVNTNAKFRAYPNYNEFAKDYVKFLSSKKYTKVRQATTAQEFIQALKDAGYATDKKYADKFMSTLNSIE